MKSVIESFFAALTMYSIIPSPVGKWSKENLRYTLCFFPLVGVLITVLILIWYEICLNFSIKAGLFASVCTLLPLGLTGGIHLDGFVDTVDALSSHAVSERKLEILKDPHIGAFGVIFCVGYLLLTFGLWYQLYASPRYIAIPAAGFIVSRALNALSIVSIPSAKDSGLVYMFSNAAGKIAPRVTSVLYVVACWLLISIWYPVWAVLAAGISVGYFVCHRRFCIWEFGGNTGDLAGFFLQNLELLLLILAVTGGVLS